MNMTDTTITGQECRKINDLLSLVGDRWTLRIVVTLQERPLRFNELRRMIDGLSQQMLTRTLKGLGRDGMVTRTVHPTVPPQVEYALTPLGRSLAREGQRLGAWVLEHLGEIDLRRAEYDRGEGQA